MLLLVSILFSGVISTPTPRATLEESPLDDQLLASIYKTCWVKCDKALGEKTDQEAIIKMISRKRINLVQFCSPYHSARNCAKACVPYEDQWKYLSPFYRRNSLAEFICVRHAPAFTRFLPCYQNETSLHFYFEHCDYFQLREQQEIFADKETCAKMDCVLKAIPAAVKRECNRSGDPNYSVEASELMEKLVFAFLSERIELTRLQNACNENSFT